MKMPMILFTACLLAAIPIRASAQEPSEPPPGPPPEMPGPDMNAPPPGEPGPGLEGEPGHPFVERWLERLKTTDPDEYAKLEKLRKDDPAEFRRLLHERLRQERMTMGGHGFRRGGPPWMSPEVQKLEEETGQMSRAYHDATDAAAKQKIREELKAKLEVLFDAKEKARLEHIQRMEADLALLKKSVEDRQTNREDIIQRRLKDLTDGDGLKW